MQHFHAVVWLDHRDAKVFHITYEESDEKIIHAQDDSEHQPSGHRDRGKSGKRPAEDKQFFEGVVKALGKAQEILIMGPAGAKQELAKFIEKHHKEMAGRVMAVEPADHMSDYQIVSHARLFFKKADRMRPQLAGQEDALQQS